MQPFRKTTEPSPGYEDFQATVLFCARCQTARPVRERLLLVLPDGELYEYLCSVCGGSVGERKVTAPPRVVRLAS
jgi:hypothetical protein